MVFLAITPSGLQEAIARARVAVFPIWCGSDAIVESDYEALEGVDLSRFEYELSNASREVILGAIETIAEHHPNETIWVEHGTEP